MKHLKLLKAAVLGGLIILTAASCTTHYEAPPAISALSFINTSPDAPQVAVYLNSNKINNDSVAYSHHIDYINAYSGTREASVYSGTTKKVSNTLDLKEGRVYSLFLAGQWASPELVLLEDSLYIPAPGKAHIRFVNMSVGSPSLDLGVNDGTTVVSNKTYKSNGSFVDIDGDKRYTFVIRQHGTTQDKVTMPSISIERGYNYTIWAKGVYTATNATGLGAEIVKNY